MSDLKNECIIQKGESIVKIFASERFGECQMASPVFSVIIQYSFARIFYGGGSHEIPN